MLCSDSQRSSERMNFPISEKRLKPFRDCPFRKEQPFISLSLFVHNDEKIAVCSENTIYIYSSACMVPEKFEHSLGIEWEEEKVKFSKRSINGTFECFALESSKSIGKLRAVLCCENICVAISEAQIICWNYETGKVNMITLCGVYVRAMSLYKEYKDEKEVIRVIVAGKDQGIENSVYVHIFNLDPKTLEFNSRRTQLEREGMNEVHSLTNICIGQDRLVVAGTFTGGIIVWTLGKTEKTKSRRVHRAITACMVAYDGKQNFISPILISCSNDLTIRVCELETLDQLCLLSGHSTFVQSVTIASFFDGVQPLLISASEDKTIKVWNLVSLKCIQTFEGDL